MLSFLAIASRSEARCGTGTARGRPRLVARRVAGRAYAVVAEAALAQGVSCGYVGKEFYSRSGRAAIA
eukprot:5396318-Lingulodinium_polyedra.AAC.1